MIGRGAVINPFIFHQIKAHFAKTPFVPLWESFLQYLETFVHHFPVEMTLRGQLSKLKCLFSFLFRGNEWLESRRNQILTVNSSDIPSYINFVLPLYKEGFIRY